MVLLVHGYLGSRLDLSHIGEALASKGFLVLTPVYLMSPTALYDATSSDTGMPIDLMAITEKLPKTLADLELSSGGAAVEDAMAAYRTGAGGGSADNDHAKRTRTMPTGGIP